MESPLLTVADVAKYIHRSEDFVRRDLKHEVAHVQHKVRGPLYFFRHDLDRWLAEHTRQPVR